MVHNLQLINQGTPCMIHPHSGVHSWLICPYFILKYVFSLFLYFSFWHKYLDWCLLVLDLLSVYPIQNINRDILILYHPIMSATSPAMSDHDPSFYLETTRKPYMFLSFTWTIPGANAYPLFELFAKPPMPALVQNQNHLSPPSGLPQSLYSSPLPWCVDEAHLHPVDWWMNNQLQQQHQQQQQQQQPLHPGMIIACGAMRNHFNCPLSISTLLLCSFFSLLMK